MRVKGANISRKLLSCGLFCLAAGALPATGMAVERPVDVAAAAAEWASGTFRSFGAAEPLLAGRVQLADEGSDARFSASLAAELKRLRIDLHEKQGWADPLPESEPLRVFVARREGQGVARLSARSIDRHRLIGATIEIDATGLSDRDVIHLVSRLYAQATLEAYGAFDATFLTSATAASLAGGEIDEDRLDSLRIAASATIIDLGRHSDTFGKFYVDEFQRVGGAAALRGVWERSAQTGEDVLPVFLRAWTETTGEKEEALLLRSAARMYASIEPEAGPARVGLADLQSGVLDAATPSTFAVRHRVFVPSAEATGALRVAWPETGASSAAIVRYRDTALPPDVVFWSPGTTRTVPLSGVARVDWIVGGTAAGPPLDALSAAVEPISGFPFAAIAPQASPGPGGTRISWTTSAHEGLSGWALFREEVAADGHIVRTGPQILPSTHQSEESYRYAYLDPDAAPGTFYRYSVWAVTDDGLLAKAFSATLRTPD